MTDESRAATKQTHGFKVAAQDGTANREIDIALFESGIYQISLITKWAGNDGPVITELALSQSGFSLFADAIMEASLNMQDWPVPSK